MINSHLIKRLSEIHQRLIDLTLSTDSDEYRCQQHPDLSPLGWHLAHTSFIERLWLCERVLDQPLNKHLHQLYLPENCSDKVERGKQLPHKEILIDEVSKNYQATIDLLDTADHPLCSHRLMNDDYLIKFLIQHHLQHIETMQMVKTQYLINHIEAVKDQCIEDPLTQDQPAKDFEFISFEQNANIEIGSSDSWGFDNEMPSHTTTIEPFAIAKNPINNRQYLQFIEDGGYHQPQYWSEDGIRWLKKAQVSAPDGWIKTAKGWYQIHSNSANDYHLDAHSPVFGINHYEAVAYVSYINASSDISARLPHEYEWEFAMKSGKLSQTKYSWEWCDNPFHPYDHFTAFPYPNYSPPAFDKEHYTLRGGSRFSQKECARPSFRNFYTRNKRHIFAGLRLAI